MADPTLFSSSQSDQGDQSTASNKPWYKELNRYHWFVLIVASLGWLFDTMDQQLFTLARTPAMRELLQDSSGALPSDSAVKAAGANATSIFLIGWAVGGLAFGVLGDRIGRARTMLLTILLYSICTGLSALSRGFWDFAFYRFITGLGVGGEFAVGVALVAEVMPARARPFALGLLQALSAVGNIAAALISITMGYLQQNGMLGSEDGSLLSSPWRMMFVIGALPALFAVAIRGRLKEPERWKAVATDSKHKPGSFGELFGTPRWRRNAIFGLVLAFSGVVGVWGIGFFSPDLINSVFRKSFESELRADGHDRLTQGLFQAALADPGIIRQVKVKTNELLGPPEQPTLGAKLWQSIIDAERQHPPGQPMSAEKAMEGLKDLAEADRTFVLDYLTKPVEEAKKPADEIVTAISTDARRIGGRLQLWAGINSVMLNIGAFFGIYMFSYLTSVVGRKPAFCFSLFIAAGSIAFLFANLSRPSDIFWMTPLMGFCMLSLFGGYAIYFPELFPTRLRSTGTSFCYNVGRLVAAIGPFVLGRLLDLYSYTSEPLRWAGVTMCAVFLLGLIVLPFLPETKDQPLPE